jgi:hypothetical protein
MYQQSEIILLSKRGDEKGYVAAIIEAKQVRKQEHFLSEKFKAEI